jgi:hypothetical protein
MTNRNDSRWHGGWQSPSGEGRVGGVMRRTDVDVRLTGQVMMMRSRRASLTRWPWLNGDIRMNSGPFSAIFSFRDFSRD